MKQNSLVAEMGAEFIGTFLLILFGCGSVAVSVWTGSYDLWAVSLMWFLGVGLGVYAAAAISGGHINPAVTIAVAAFDDEFEWGKVIPYIVAQILGAFVAAAAIHLAVGGILAAFEATNGIIRGAAGSQLSAMAFTTFAPNPAIIGTGAEALAQVTMTQWFLSEVIITAILVFGVFFLIEAANEQRPMANWWPGWVGLLVAALVAYEAPVSMAALNPARDLGPRIWILLTGWGQIAFPGPRGGFWIPTVSTIVGGLIGGAIYYYVYRHFYGTEETEELEAGEIAAQA